MTLNVQSYMNDGKCAQAQCVLAILREIGSEHEIEVRPYSNCREQGYTFSLIGSKHKELRHYTVYEHRNCDDLCVQVNDETKTCLLEEYTTWEDAYQKENQSKNDISKRFKPYDVYKCAKWIVEDMDKLYTEEERWNDKKAKHDSWHEFYKTHKYSKY